MLNVRRDGVGGGQPPQRLLVSRLRYAGDAILSLPLLSALRAAWPSTELHYLAEPATLEVLSTQPEIHRAWAAGRGVGPTLALGAALRRQRFSAAIDLFCNPRSALLIASTGAPIRIGEDRRVRRHAYTVARHLVPGRSAIEQHLDAMRPLGLQPPAASRPILHLPEAERAAGQAAWQRALGRSGILLHLGASHADKEWPHAPEFATRVAQAGTAAVLSTVPGRAGPWSEAAAASGLPVLPPLGLRAFLGVVATARAVVSVDGAIVHAAVALGRPTVALFGPTDARVWFPYVDFGPYRVLRDAADCRRCQRDPDSRHTCMAALRPAAVTGALAAVLEGAP